MIGKLIVGVTVAIIFLAVVVFVAVLLALPTMLIVNYLVAPSALIAVFGTSSLGFWQAFWLNVLCGILFKSSAANSSK